MRLGLAQEGRRGAGTFVWYLHDGADLLFGTEGIWLATYLAFQVASSPCPEVPPVAETPPRVMFRVFAKLLNVVLRSGMPA